MPLQTSGPISIANLRGEFGGAAPDGMSEYRAGAGRVPSGCSGTTGAIPSTLSNLNLGRFYGACVATAPPSTSGRINVGTTSDIPGIFPGNGYYFGHSKVCINTVNGLEPGPGSLASGSLNIDGRNVWSIGWFRDWLIVGSSGFFMMHVQGTDTRRYVIDIDYYISGGSLHNSYSFDTNDCSYRTQVSVSYGGTCISGYTATESVWSNGNFPNFAWPAAGDYFDFTITRVS